MTKVDNKHIKDVKDQIEAAAETEEVVTKVETSMEKEVETLDKMTEEINKILNDDFDEARKKINSTLTLSDNLMAKIEDYITSTFQSDLTEKTLRSLGITADILQRITTIRERYINLLLTIHRTRKNIMGKSATNGGEKSKGRGGMTVSKIKSMIKNERKTPF